MVSRHSEAREDPLEVGDDGGGFILSAGCDTPPHTKPENSAAFLETRKYYELSKPQRQRW